MRKHNEGYTLVELIVVIAVAGLVASAAFSLLYLGVKINARAGKQAVQQNNVRLVMEVMGDLIREEAVSVVETPVDGSTWSVNNDRVYYDGESIYITTGENKTELLGEISSSKLTRDTENHQLITIEINMASGHSYTTSLYCRLLSPVEPASDEGSSDLLAAYAVRDYRQVLDFAVQSKENPEPVSQFLSVLASQYGSRGQILNEAGESTGDYFSRWYIGSYEENPDWSEETPWCACYLSWALAQCDGLEEPPRFANVDLFWAEFVTGQSWSVDGPVPGDIIFFDWVEDEAYDPQHVGAVLTVSDGWVYTIEGNSGGRVTVCRYDLEDPSILGYGKLNWK